MTRKVITTGLALTAACLILSSLAFAKAGEVKFGQPVKLGNGPEIQPGSYKVTVVTDQANPEVHFYRGNQIAAKARVKLVELPRKADRTEIHTELHENSRILTELHLKGFRESLVFHDSADETTSAGK